jgi:curli biogenesis system outer membrane secretion channel CsgG
MFRSTVVAAAAALALAAAPAFAQTDAKTTPAQTPAPKAHPMVHHHAGSEKMGHGGSGPSAADHMADQLNAQVLTSIQQGGTPTPAGAPMPGHPGMPTN